MIEPPLCTLEQIDAMLARGQAADADYTEQMKLDARDAATAAFEREAGVAFSPRTVTRRLRSRRRGYLELPDTRVTAVTAVTADGTPLTEDELAGLDLDGDAILGLQFTHWGANVTYVHGYEETPADVSRAIAVLSASMLKDGPYDDRGFGVTDEGGSVRLMTAGIGGAAFSLPEVQATLARYQRVFAL